MLIAGRWNTINAQVTEVKIPMGLLRDYSLTKEQLKVSRDSVVLLGADVVMWRDSTAFYKKIYLKECRRKKNWRLVALLMGAKEILWKVFALNP